MTISELKEEIERKLFPDLSFTKYSTKLKHHKVFTTTYKK